MSTTKIRIVIAGTLALGVVGSTALTAASALASGGGGGVRTNGACSASGTWKMKAKHDNSILQVEAEVDVNKVGQHWTWTLADNGVRKASGRSVTVAPSGSFTVSRNIGNQTGTDKITFHAVNSANGNTCNASVSI